MEESIPILSFGIKDTAFGKSELMNYIFNKKFEVNDQCPFSLNTIDIDLDFDFRPTRNYCIADSHGILDTKLWKTLFRLFKILIVQIRAETLKNFPNDELFKFREMMTNQQKVILIIRDGEDQNVDFSKIKKNYFEDVDFIHILISRCNNYQDSKNFELTGIKSRVLDIIQNIQDKPLFNMDAILSEELLMRENVKAIVKAKEIFLQKLKSEQILAKLFPLTQKEKEKAEYVDSLNLHRSLFKDEQGSNAKKTKLAEIESDLKKLKMSTAMEIFVQTLKIKGISYLQLQYLKREISKFCQSSIKVDQETVEDFRQKNDTSNPIYKQALENIRKRTFTMDDFWHELLLFSNYNEKQIDLDISTVFLTFLLKGEGFQLINESLKLCDNTLKLLGKILDEKKIYVISTIGCQSSGKSTFLNYVFGSDFETSAGRCTKGVYCSLIEVHDSEYNYILVLDTEGFESAEKDNGDEGDRKIALFIMTVSQAVIVNGQGELNKYTLDLLKSCALSLYEMEKCKIESPEIFICLNRNDDFQHEKFNIGLNKAREDILKVEPNAAKVCEILNYNKTRFSIMSSAFAVEHIPDFNFKYKVPNELFSSDCKTMLNRLLKNMDERLKNLKTTGGQIKYISIKNWEQIARENWKTIEQFPLTEFANVKQTLLDKELMNFLLNEWRDQLKPYEVNSLNKIDEKNIHNYYEAVSDKMRQNLNHRQKARDYPKTLFEKAESSIKLMVDIYREIDLFNMKILKVEESLFQKIPFDGSSQSEKIEWNKLQNEFKQFYNTALKFYKEIIKGDTTQATFKGKNKKTNLKMENSNPLEEITVSYLDLEYDEFLKKLIDFCCKLFFFSENEMLYDTSHQTNSRSFFQSLKETTMNYLNLTKYLHFGASSSELTSKINPDLILQNIDFAKFRKEINYILRSPSTENIKKKKMTNLMDFKGLGILIDEQFLKGIFKFCKDDETDSEILLTNYVEYAVNSKKNLFTIIPNTQWVDLPQETETIDKILKIKIKDLFQQNASLNVNMKIKKEFESNYGEGLKSLILGISQYNKKCGDTFSLMTFALNQREKLAKDAINLKLFFEDLEKNLKRGNNEISVDFILSIKDEVNFFIDRINQELILLYNPLSMNAKSLIHYFSFTIFWKRKYDEFKRKGEKVLENYKNEKNQLQKNIVEKEKYIKTSSDKFARIICNGINDNIMRRFERKTVDSLAKIISECPNRDKFSSIIIQNELDKYYFFNDSASNDEVKHYILKDQRDRTFFKREFEKLWEQEFAKVIKQKKDEFEKIILKIYKTLTKNAESLKSKLDSFNLSERRSSDLIHFNSLQPLLKNPNEKGFDRAAVNLVLRHISGESSILWKFQDEIGSYVIKSCLFGLPPLSFELEVKNLILDVPLPKMEAPFIADFLNSLIEILKSDPILCPNFETHPTIASLKNKFELASIGCMKFCPICGKKCDRSLQFAIPHSKHGCDSGHFIKG